MLVSKTALLLTLALTVASMSPALASVGPADPGVAAAYSSVASRPAEGCRPSEIGYRCFYGPVDVPAGEMAEINAPVAAPPEPGYVTSLRATLVDANGDRVAHHMVHLHHAVWINPNKRDSTCASFGQGLPNWDRFFGTGKERTRVVMPEGYGYFWDNKGNSYSQDPFWLLTAHLDGMHGQQNVFVRLDLGFTPLASASG